MPRTSGWDTAYGYELYLKGLKDGEIADALGVKICTITSYRHRHWKKGPDGGRGAPPRYRGRQPLSLLRRQLP